MHEGLARGHRGRGDGRPSVPRHRRCARAASPAAGRDGDVCGNGARHRDPCRFRARASSWISSAASGCKGRSPVALARALLLLPMSGVDAWRILSQRSPDVVIGVGGYSSGPVVLAAATADGSPRCSSNRTPCPVSPTGCWRAWSMPLLSRSKKPSPFSGGGALSQAIRSVRSSLEGESQLDPVAAARVGGPGS